MPLSLLDNVPHLITANTQPLNTLEKHLLQHRLKIETWLRDQWRQTPPVPYCSVDLRNAGFKLAPVDTNLFPAGFNNLNGQFLPLCVQAAQATLESQYPGCQRLLLIPENHTRNLFYLENIAMIRDIFNQAGFDIRLGSLLNEITSAQEFTLPSGKTILLEPIKREGNYLTLDQFTPCMILLNHDLSDGIPDILQNLEQTILPSPQLGWAQRLKSQHFRHYDDVANTFSEIIDIDPWLINPYFDALDNINFVERQGDELLAEKTAELLNKIAIKYKQYQITEKPYVVIKADAGTYGMGILTIDDPKKILELNRKQRAKMSTSKGNQPISRVILQEGVYTFETLGKEEAVAEPVVYMIGQHVVGGFYRVHKERGVNENLNAPGAHFEPLAFAQSCNNPNNNRFYSYGVIARLALLAAARESHEVKQHAK